jgi:hypothetical protein
MSLRTESKKVFSMFFNLDEIAQIQTKQFEAVSGAATAVAKSWQNIVSETGDYAKQSFEKRRVLTGKLFGVKKIDELIQLQSEFAKEAYDDFLTQATKIGKLCSDLATEAFKPIEVTTRPVAEPTAPLSTRVPKTPVVAN